MELRHLRYFVAVAEQQSFSLASAKLFIAQPPLSTQIKQLEDEVGTPLLIRHSRGVSLTPAGAVFLAEARHILDRADRAKRLAQQEGDQNRGELSIGFIPSASHGLIPRLIRRIHTEMPGVEVKVQEMITADQEKAIAVHALDVGIARPPIHTAIVAVAAELSDPFCLAIPDDHQLARKRGAIALTAASKETFVSFTRYRSPAYFDQTIALCSAAGFSPDIRMDASTIFGVLSLVSAGLGVAIVPASCVTIRIEGIVFRPLRQPSLKGAIAFIKLKGDKNPVVEHAANLMREIFVELEGVIRGQLNTKR